MGTTFPASRERGMNGNQEDAGNVVPTTEDAGNVVATYRSYSAHEELVSQTRTFTRRTLGRSG